jgi:ABC-type uncharacterized transport system substrate-binding protein
MLWVQSINQGIKAVFADKAYISLRYFYMNTKAIRSEAYLDHLGKALRRTIKSWKPDILIAFDEDAQKLALRDYGHSASIKVILAGISDYKQWVDYDKAENVWGIREHMPVKAICEILSLMFHDKKRIYYLSDNSTIAKTLDQRISTENWGKFQIIAHKRVDTLAEWQKAVAEAGQKADILLVSVYQTLKDGNKEINSKQLVAWMNRNSTIPVVGVYESFIVDGGLLAIAISSQEQGYMAASLALNRIEKRLTTQKNSLLHGKTFSLFMQKERLLKRFPEVNIPVILDTFSIKEKIR